MCMYLSICLCITNRSLEVRRSIRPLVTGITNSHEPPCEWWELNPGPSAKAVSALTGWAIAPAPLSLVFSDKDDPWWCLREWRSLWRDHSNSITDSVRGGLLVLKALLQLLLSSKARTQASYSVGSQCHILDRSSSTFLSFSIKPFLTRLSVKTKN